MIKDGTFEFPSPYWDNISDLAKDLISKLLTVNPSERLDADGIMSHPWIKGEGTPREEMPEVISNIRKFNARRRLKKAGTAVIGSIRWLKLAQAAKGNVPQSSKQVMENSQAAAASVNMVEHSPATNNYMMASENGEGDSMTPNHEATAANGGFGEMTQEVDMRSDNRSQNTVNMN